MKIVYKPKPEVTVHKVLDEYQREIAAIVSSGDMTKPESALATWHDKKMLEAVESVVNKIGRVKHVVLLGTGGSSLGIEAIHAALRKPDTTTLHVLDAVSDTALQFVLSDLKDVSLNDIAVCIISKSGGTTETISNAATFLARLEQQNSNNVYGQVVCIGNEGNHLLAWASDVGAYTVAMPEAIGGRYSVTTTVGLVPLALLGYEVSSFLRGVEESVSNDDLAREGAVSLCTMLESGIRNINFFAFEKELATLGAWYRQLAAESLGKETDEEGNKVSLGFVPTISTPVELHSIGQLYFSGFSGVYTDFVRVEDISSEYTVPIDSTLATATAGKSITDVARAIEGGVLAAYTERGLPYRLTTLSALNERTLGKFMALRMREVMYLAKLLNVNAFNQPNVELYKQKTKEIL